MVWECSLAGVPKAPLFDDGIPGGPDDPTFTTAQVAAYVAASGGTLDGFNFVGQSAADPLEA